jgi:plasmid stabilization system protein ParE
MSLSVTFRCAARAEFDAAADWYEQRRDGLGARFTSAVQRVLDQAAVKPERYPKVFQEVRQGVVHGFPFCVYYREENGQLIVLAVFHSSRDPAIWQERA